MLTIIGAPFAAPLAVVAGLFSLVPLVGATIAAVLIGIVTLFGDFPTDTILWTVWAIVYQQIENNLIQPQVQKRTVNVNGFVVLVSVLFGATLLGVLGALVAIPIAASIQIVIREWWNYRRDARLDRGCPTDRSRALPARAGARLTANYFFGSVARLERQRLILRHPGFELATALELGVQLGAQQHRDVRDPQPDQEDDHATQAAVGLVVGGEARDVERERRPTRRSRGGRPARRRESASESPAASRWAPPSRGPRTSKLTSSTSTGHFAMSHAVTAASPRPITLPTCSASGPVSDDGDGADRDQDHHHQRDRDLDRAAASRTDGPPRPRRSSSTRA